MTTRMCLAVLVLAMLGGCGAPTASDDADAVPDAAACGAGLALCPTDSDPRTFVCVDLATHPSYTMCGNECVASLQTPHHCGACGVDCGSGFCIVATDGRAPFCER